MHYNCQKLTEIMKGLSGQIPNNFSVEKLAEAMEKRRENREKLEEGLGLAEDYRLDCQIEKRDRLAKKLGLSYLCRISDERAWGREIGSDYLALVDTEKEEFVRAIPACLEATDFVAGHSFIRTKSYYAMIDRHDIISKKYEARNHGFTGRGEFPDFNGQPILIEEKDTSGKIAAVKRDFYLTPDGREILENAVVQEYLDNFSEGLLWVKDFKGMFGLFLVNKKGELLGELPKQYFLATPMYNGKCFLLEVDSKYGNRLCLFDQNAETKYLGIDLNVPEIHEAGEGFYQGWEKGNAIYFHPKGTIIRTTDRGRRSFADGYISIENERETVVYDRNGKQQFQSNFQKLPTSDGMIMLREPQGGFTFYNLRKKKFIMEDDRAAKLYKVAEYFQAGRAVVTDEEDGLDQRLIDRAGNFIARLDSDFNLYYEDGVFDVMDGMGNHVKYIDRYGKEVFNPDER